MEIEPTAKGTYTFFQLDPKMSFWTRLRFALSIALTPLTLLWLGRSIRVPIPRKELE